MPGTLPGGSRASPQEGVRAPVGKGLAGEAGSPSAASRSWGLRVPSAEPGRGLGLLLGTSSGQKSFFFFIIYFFIIIFCKYFSITEEGSRERQQGHP